MTEWTVFGVVAALVSFVIAVSAPILKLNSTITKLSVIIDNALRRLDNLEKQDDKFREDSKASHQKIHNRIDKVESNMQDHERRIFAIERKEGIQ